MICVIAWRNRGTSFLTTYKWGMANNCIIVLHWNDMCLKIRIIPACCCVSTAKWKSLCLVLWISGDIKTTTLVNCLVFPNTQGERNYWTFLCCIDVDSLCCRTIPFKDVVQMKIDTVLLLFCYLFFWLCYARENVVLIGACKCPGEHLLTMHY